MTFLFGTAKPCVASAVCSTFVRCTITLSPTLAVTMSGVKWLRTTFIHTSVTPGRWTMRASFSLAMESGLLRLVAGDTPGSYTSCALMMSALTICA